MRFVFFKGGIDLFLDALNKNVFYFLHFFSLSSIIGLNFIRQL